MSIIGKTRYLQSLLQGIKTSRKIIVIESDDWGSERIPNKNVRDELREAGIDVISNPHSKYDTLETEEDLEVLEDVLHQIYIQYGKKVTITANFITGNPDYNKIKKNNFEKYFYEPFETTYSNRDGNKAVIAKIKNLINNGYIRPQFHGREHINVQFWLDELRNKNPSFLKAFELQCYGIDAKSKQDHRNNLMASFEYNNTIQQSFIENSIKEGMQLFKTTFGYQSKTIIAPRYIWNNDLEKEFKAAGIKYIQTTFYQQEPTNVSYKNIYHYTGQVNKVSGLKYIVRNSFFEPAYSREIDWINQCFNKIKLAFRFYTPAIISMHRINFVGGIDLNNRTNNMNQFKILLQKIIEAYPDVEFLSSDQIGELFDQE